jgi:hypothetical protein
MALTHYLAVVPISIELGFLLFSSRKITKYQKWGLALSFAALVIAQGWIYAHFFKWDGLQWQLIKSSAEPSIFWPKDLLLALGNRSLIASAVIGGIWIMGLIRLLNAPEGERGAQLSLVALILGPVIVFSAASLLSARALLLPRYFIFLVPPLCIFLGTVRVRHKNLAALLAGLFLVGSAAGVRDYYFLRKEPWRDAAAIVQKYPNSIVYTTRTLALRTPYFNRIGVEVRPLRAGSSTGITEIASAVAEGKKVWILENFWGGYSYMPELKQTLNSLNLQISELSLTDENSSPVFVMLVEKKS